MTYKLTIRTAPGALIASEYLCPVHGRFTIDVPREANGDPPSEQPCSVPMVETGWIKLDDNFLPRDPGDPALRVRPVPCGLPSPYVISASGTAKVRLVEAVRGKYQKPERPTWTDTTNLGEGQDLDDWHDDRAKVWERHRENTVKELERELG
jgi:hypothetical protein